MYYLKSIKFLQLLITLGEIPPNVGMTSCQAEFISASLQINL